MFSSTMRSFRQPTSAGAASNRQAPSLQGIYANQASVQRACDMIGRRPWDAQAYNTLGDALGANEPPATLGAVREPLTKKECYRKAAELDPGNAHAFYRLGLLLGEEVKVGNETFTKKACFIKAAELNPDNSDAFHQLAALLSPSDVVVIGGRSLTRKDCLGKQRGGVTGYLFFKKSLFNRSLSNRIPASASSPSHREEMAQSIVPDTQGGSDIEDTFESDLRDSEEGPVMDGSFLFAARPDSQMRESYTIPTLGEDGDIGFRDVSTADLEPEFAENLHNILSQDDGYQRLVAILRNAKRLNDIATNPDVGHLITRHYTPPEGNLRTYYQAFNQAMECMFCTAQAVTSGLIPIKKSTALSTAFFANRAIHLGMPNVIAAGLLMLVKQKQDTKTLNNLGKILQFFRNADELKHVTRDVSKAICVTQEDALNHYAEEHDAAAQGGVVKTAKNFTTAWLPKRFAPGSNKFLAASEKRAKNAELQTDRHLEASPMGRKALRDIHQLLDAIIALPEEKFAELDRLAPSHRTKAIVTLMKKALHVQDLGANDDETKWPVPDAGNGIAMGESSVLSNQQQQDFQQLVADMRELLQVQKKRTDDLENQVVKLQTEVDELKRNR